jgi:translation initiation factor 3 subunit A
VQVAVLRMLKQLGQVYSVMKIERLRKLVPFMDFGRVEAIIVDAVKNDYIQACTTLTQPQH